MLVKERLKAEIDRLDERYLELAFKIICQFPRTPDKPTWQQQEQEIPGQEIANILQEIADSGGLGISDPVEWQREVRQDRILPFRSE
jgi:hypothetical protein